MNLAKLIVKKKSKRYEALVQGIKSGSVYVYDMFSAETKNCKFKHLISLSMAQNSVFLSRIERLNFWKFDFQTLKILTPVLAIYVYIILPVNDPITENLCSLENALNQDLHQSRKALIFKNVVVLLKTLHEKNVAHLALDLRNIWIEDLFYVYLGPFSFEEKKDELDTALPFAAPEILLC